MASKNPKKKVVKNSSIDTVGDGVGSYEKHPFFVKKAAAAKELLLQVGLPEEVTKKVYSHK